MAIRICSPVAKRRRGRIDYGGSNLSVQPQSASSGSLIRIEPPDRVDEAVVTRHLRRLQPQSELLLECGEEIRRRRHARRIGGNLDQIGGYRAERVPPR